MTTYNFYKTENGKTFAKEERVALGGSGKYESVAFKSETLCEMEGISLRKEGTNVVKYSLWMDGEPINKYTNRKTAVEMFLDFCGVPDRKRKALEKALMAA